MNTSINNPHDKLFKAAMADLEVATSFFIAHLPIGLKKRVHWKTLSLAQGNYIDKSLGAHATDVLYRVQLKHSGHMYLLVEQQTNPDKLMAFRLLQYMVHIWNQYLKQTSKPNKPVASKKLPVIYPIVYYNGNANKKPYPYSADLLDCFTDKVLAKQYLFRPFQLVDLTRISDKEIKKHHLAAALELIQKHIWDKDADLILKKTEKIWHIAERHDSDYFETLLKYAINQGNVKQPEEFLEKLSRLLPKARRKIMTIAEYLEKKGREEGKTQTLNKIAAKLLQSGQSIEFVAAMTNLPKRDIKKLQKTLH